MLKLNHEHMLNANFVQCLPSTHRIDVPFWISMQSLRRRCLCAHQREWDASQKNPQNGKHQVPNLWLSSDINPENSYQRLWTIPMICQKTSVQMQKRSKSHAEMFVEASHIWILPINRYWPLHNLSRSRFLSTVLWQ